MIRIFKLIDNLNITVGVLRLVHDGKETVNALLKHPNISIISFIRSYPVA